VRLPDTTRSALRELLLAELTDAGTRAHDAGWPPEVLADVVGVRLKSAAEDAGDPPGPGRG
jgi:hypothetical protein